MYAGGIMLKTIRENIKAAYSLHDMNVIEFDIAENNEELISNIHNFSYEKYVEKVRRFRMKHGVLEDGNASQRVADKIESLVRE